MKLICQEEGQRLDVFLSQAVEGLTRSAAQRLLEAGAVRRNGKAAKKNEKTAQGDVIELELPEPQSVDIAPRDIPLEIVYEDEDVLVINKPKGLVVHPAAGHWDDTLVNALMYCRETACPASTASCARGSSTASTRTPPGC